MSRNIVADRPTVAAALAPCAFSLLLAGFPVQAQEGDGFGYSTLEGVTATATKTARDPFDVAESVSVVDEERIEETQATDLADLLADLPNVDVAGGSRSIGQRVVIRGLSDDRILFVIDGARQNYDRAHDSRIFLDPDLFKQVEVLRGPASALWGSGALGGVISFTTKDAADWLAPGQTFGARLKAGYQDVNAQKHIGAAVYGRAGDSLDYLLDLSYRDAKDTELGDGSTLEHSAFDSLAGLAKLTWTPAPFHALSGSFQSYDYDGEVPSNAQTAGSDADLVDRAIQQRNTTLRYRYDNPADAYLKPTVVLYHNATDIDEKRLTDGRRDQTDFTTTGLDARNSMTFGQAGQFGQVLTYGFDVYRDEASATRDGAPRDSYPDAQATVLGLYLQDEIFVGDRWTLTPGLRWDRYRSESDTGVADDQDESELSKKLGLGYRVTSWLSLHAAYTEAFRAPDLTELFVSGTHFTCGPGCANRFVPNPDLKPEKAHNKEIGARLRRDDLFVAGDQGRFRATGFRNDVEDFIDSIVIFSPRPVPGNPGPGGITTNQNVRDAKLTGFELELAYDAPRWTAGVAYSQTRGDNADTGEPLSDIPADAWSLRAGLRFPAQHLTLNWRTQIVNDQDRIPAGGEPTDGYTVHDIGLSWVPRHASFKGLRIDAGIDNITDVDYRQHLSVLKAPGRNAKAALSYSF